MKTNLCITLDQEIVEKLKRENNYSNLINEQIKGFYAVKDCENKEILLKELTKIKQILKENRRKRRDIEAQIKKIDLKSAKIKKDLKQKNITRSKLIKTIRERRAEEARQPHSRTEYFITPEEEADIRLKGGKV